MNKLTMIKNVVIKTAGRSSVLVTKYSPEILMVSGVVGIVVSTVMACRATLKVDAVIEEAREKINEIKDAEKIFPTETYSETDYKKDITITYVKTGVAFIKLYGPSVLIGVVSIGCILGAHNILHRRNVAIIAAYKALEQGFSSYRKRVIEEFGVDKDRQFKNGLREKETITPGYTDEDGVKHKATKGIIEFKDPNENSQYARVFDDKSVNWSNTPEYNMFFLMCQQNYLNDRLHAYGHVFLNEVYDRLGIPRSSAGAVVGWVMGDSGDNIIDFGIFEIDKPANCDFINGYERAILLDFNVDGIIYDMI